MIDVSDKTFAQLLADMLARVDDGLNKREGSLIRTSLAAAAWSMEGLFLELANVQRQAFAKTATGDYLDLKAYERGLERKPATYAVKRGVFNVAPAIGTRFSTKNYDPMLVYAVSSASEAVSGGYACNLTCDTAGAIGNVYTGDLLPLSFVAGLASATLGGSVEVGADIETDAALRERYMRSLVEIAFGGNIAAYDEFISAIPGVGGVQVWPCYNYSSDSANQGGFVTIAITGDDGLPAAAALVNTVQNAVDPGSLGRGIGMAPIGSSVKIIAPSEYPVDVVVGIEGTVSEDDVRACVNEYFAEVRKKWKTPQEGAQGSYIVVYLNMLLGRLTLLDGVVNVHTLTFNGAASDLIIYQYNSQMSPKLQSNVPVVDSIIFAN